MRICIIGSSGNMGKRYCSILKYLGHEVIEHDLDTGTNLGAALKHVNKAIIATPTGTHENFFGALIDRRIPFLCEKPMSTNIGKLEWLNKQAIENDIEVKMVCNWKFIRGGMNIGSHKVRYNHFRTGNDGLEWDCIQLIMLAKETGKRNYDISLRTTSPVFDVQIDDKQVTLDDIDNSYLFMLDKYCSEPDELWGTKQAIEGATRVNYMLRAK